MINRCDEQFFKIQLKLAADVFDAERRMRLAAGSNKPRRRLPG
jgi:hypothetical protein